MRTSTTIMSKVSFFTVYCRTAFHRQSRIYIRNVRRTAARCTRQTYASVWTFFRNLAGTPSIISCPSATAVCEFTESRSILTVYAYLTTIANYDSVRTSPQYHISDMYHTTGATATTTLPTIAAGIVDATAATTTDKQNLNQTIHRHRESPVFRERMDKTTLAASTGSTRRTSKCSLVGYLVITYDYNAIASCRAAASAAAMAVDTCTRSGTLSISRLDTRTTAAATAGHVKLVAETCTAAAVPHICSDNGTAITFTTPSRRRTACRFADRSRAATAAATKRIGRSTAIVAPI